MNENFKLYGGLYFASVIQDYIEYIIKNMKQ